MERLSMRAIMLALATMSPVAIDIDTAGNVLILDASYPFSIRVLQAGTGIIHTAFTFAGSDDAATDFGDAGPANSASVRYPEDVTVDSRQPVHCRYREFAESAHRNAAGVHGHSKAGFFVAA